MLTLCELKANSMIFLRKNTSKKIYAHFAFLFLASIVTSPFFVLSVLIRLNLRNLKSDWCAQLSFNQSLSLVWSRDSCHCACFLQSCALYFRARLVQLSRIFSRFFSPCCFLSLSFCFISSLQKAFLISNAMLLGLNLAHQENNDKKDHQLFA